MLHYCMHKRLHVYMRIRTLMHSRMRYIFHNSLSILCCCSQFNCKAEVRLEREREKGKREKKRRKTNKRRKMGAGSEKAFACRGTYVGLMIGGWTTD